MTGISMKICCYASKTEKTTRFALFYDTWRIVTLWPALLALPFSISQPCKYGNAEITRYLINLGANVDAENQIKQTPLMYAVEANQWSVVRTLLDANADVLKRDETHGVSVARRVVRDLESRGSSGEPACKKVCGGDDRENVRLAVLSKVTSSESFRNNDSASHLECPLYHFIELKDAEVTRALLAKGQPVNAKKEGNGETALHEAARRLDLGNVRVLLEYNADVNAADECGKTPLSRIQSFEDQKKTLAVVKALTDAGAMLIYGEHNIIQVESILRNGNEEMIETLLQCPVDLRIHLGTYVKTPLFHLAMNKNPKMLEKLRDLRADDFEQSKDKLLFFVSAEFRADSVKFLLRCDASVNAKDEYDRTLIRAVVKEGVLAQISRNDKVSDRCLACIELLLERGADPQKFQASDNVISARDEEFGDRITPLIEPIFAYLSLQEARGRAINRHTQYEIQSSSLLGNVFQANKRHFEEMKTVGIDESVTLFDFLTANDRQIVLYARNKVLISKLINIIKMSSFNSYSGRMLNKRFLKFSLLVDWKEKLVAVMNEVLRELCDRYINNVAEKIVEYLVREKWEEIGQVCT